MAESGWRVRGFSVVVLALAMGSMGCPGDDSGPDSAGTEAATSAGPTSGPTSSPTSGPTSGPTSAADTTEGPPLDCASVNAGDPCTEPDAECTYGDDCGSWTYRCEGGQWVQIGGDTCGAPPVACEDGPQAGDNCDPPVPACDPDGDCQDVLECVGGVWEAYALCSEEFCAGEQVEGEPCDEPGRSCPEPCIPDQPTFFCTTEGWQQLGTCAR